MSALTAQFRYSYDLSSVKGFISCQYLPSVIADLQCSNLCILLIGPSLNYIGVMVIFMIPKC